jgi:hypothetical protein
MGFPCIYCVKVRVLITNFWLNDFNDSEHYCLEFIDYCKANGHEVEIYAIDIDPTMRTYLQANEITIWDPHSSLANSHFDLMWVHHNVIPREFLADTKHKFTVNAVVTHHMSAFEPNDVPFIPELEAALSNKVIANTRDVKLMLSSFGFSQDEVQVVGTLAPSDYVGTKNFNPELNKFLFISNNAPDELLTAISMLETMGFEVKTVERDPVSRERNWISPEDIEWADAIIAIEETVQYAVLSRRPIYLYNQVSGIGWVTDEDSLNNALIQTTNSEVVNNVLSVSRIVEQFLADFDHARDFIANLNHDFVQKFQLETCLDQIFSEIESSMDKTVNRLNLIEPQQKISLLHIQDSLNREVQSRRFAQASAKQALLERSLVISENSNNEAYVAGLEKNLDAARARIEELEAVSSRKFALSNRSAK